MNKLSLSQMEKVEGGKAKDVIDGVNGACAIIAVVGVFGGPVGWGAASFCAGWGLCAAFC
ncbi:hypothetical protein GCM10028808_43510 [Spirosoma migulaei]